MVRIFKGYQRVTAGLRSLYAPFKGVLRSNGAQAVALTQQPDQQGQVQQQGKQGHAAPDQQRFTFQQWPWSAAEGFSFRLLQVEQIGRASCGGRGEISVGAG